MPKKTTTQKRKSASVAIPENEQPDRSAIQAFDRARWDREMRWCKQSFDQAGSLPALVDALICSHKSQDPLPKWVAVGTIAVIKAYFTDRPLLFDGKPFRRSGRKNAPASRHRYSLVELERWECVKEIKERQQEFTENMPYLSDKEREAMPEFAQLIKKKFSLNHRYSVAVEHLALHNDPAKCDFDQMKASYQKVENAMRHGKPWEYRVPGSQNPLMSSHDPDLLGNKPT